MKHNAHLAAEQSFNSIMQFCRTYDIRVSWEILVVHYEDEGRYYCELYRTDDDAAGVMDDVMHSAPFKTPKAALLWAHRFDVPVLIESEELYSDGE